MPALIFTTVLKAQPNVEIKDLARDGHYFILENSALLQDAGGPADLNFIAGDLANWQTVKEKRFLNLGEPPKKSMAEIQFTKQRHSDSKPTDRICQSRY